jgi:DNA replication protein DnaC
MSILDQMSTEEKLEWNDLMYWFEEIPSEKWIEMSSEAADNKLLAPGERKFLYDFGKNMLKDNEPTLKQLKYAKSIYEKYILHKEGNSILTTTPVKSENSSNISHATIRVAWHDSGWSGTFCKDPESNEYCTGEHSLLSRRIRERKNSSSECLLKGKSANSLIPDYQPPCYWCINLQGTKELHFEHDNPAAPNVKHIPEKLPPFSVFSWPFKLSFVRDDNQQNQFGNYYPENMLQNRIDHFLNKLKPHRSISFFYANFDNPVSGEEQKYLLLGCAVLSSIGDLTTFDISKEELSKLRKRKNCQNFPRLSWNVRYSFDMPDKGFILPYHQYLELIENGTLKDDAFLNDIKATIDEPEIISGFKYVNMDIDNDNAIYLLWKLKKSLLKIKEHGLVDYPVEKALVTTDLLLEICWKERGLLPGWINLIQALLGQETEEDNIIGKCICDLKEHYPDSYPLKLSECIQNPRSIDPVLKPYQSLFARINERLGEIGLEPIELIRLSNINLFRNQFKSLITGVSGILQPASVALNPYTLFESYEPGKFLEDIQYSDIIDGPIPLFKIDIAMFPDQKYLLRDNSLHNMKYIGPERLRALIISYLRSLEQIGDCFEESSRIKRFIVDYPLFYRNDDTLNRVDLKNIDEITRNHFNDHLYIYKDETDGRIYYYLKDVYEAEQNIKRVVLRQMNQPDISKQYDNFDSIILDSSEELKKRLKTRFDEDTFLTERGSLHDNIIKKRFFVLAGSPGTGKSHELLAFIERIKQKEESYILLTPTGKAALRLRSDSKFGKINVSTIDKYLSDHYKTKNGTAIVDNLIIDEMSMVDLFKLSELLDKFNFNGDKVSRLIFAGDPNQLPAIGYGKAFFDIIEYIKQHNPKYSNNFIDLCVNCRQETDDTIIRFARIFANQSKNREKMFDEVNEAEGRLSDGLYIYKWNSKEELRGKIVQDLLRLYNKGNKTSNMPALLNNVFGLDANGKFNNTTDLKLDAFQILSPYRTCYYGTTGLNQFIQKVFRENSPFHGSESASAVFKESDKIICTKNLYSDHGKLIVSNGSIGLAANNRYYYPEADDPIYKDNENQELAYAITVHKAQGSSFEHTFVIVPEKNALLSKELFYTAISRSRAGMSLFIYKSQENAISLSDILNRSYTERRKTSIFTNPSFGYSYMPADGIKVKSRIEYIIFKKLEEARLKHTGIDFKYEEPYKGPRLPFRIHPDFTIFLQNGKCVYWEHLGKITDRNYRNDWSERKEIYRINNDIPNLVTTDEVKGINDQKIDKIINDIVTNNLSYDPNCNQYSSHHYSLNE